MDPIARSSCFLSFSTAPFENIVKLHWGEACWFLLLYGCVEGVGGEGEVADVSR